MIFIVAIFSFSFLLESIVTNYIGINSSILYPVFSLISLIVIYPFFNNNNSKFLFVSFWFGLIYDIAYTNSFLLNATIFVIISAVIILLNEHLSNNHLNISINCFVIVVLYRVITYLLICLVGYVNFDYIVLIKSIYTTLLSNLIYVNILYFISNQLSTKYKIRKID